MKKIVIIGVAAAAIGVLVGTQLPKGVVLKPISITTFKIKTPFRQWVDGFDSKEASKMHKAYGITPLYRGVSIKDPYQVVVIHQSAPGAVDKLLSDNQEIIESTGHILRTTKTNYWSFN